MSESEALSEQEILGLHEEECAAALESFKRDLQKVRTGRASTGLVEGLMVDYYGSRTQLSHLGQIAAPEARLVTVQVFDAGAVSAVEKAIQTSGLGLNPSIEGTLVRINIPTLTEEGRKEIVKYLNKIAEDIKISIRNHRRDSNDIVKAQEKDSSLSKDDAKRVLEKIQNQTDKRISEVDTLLKAKEAECLEV